jgi:cyanate permease
VASVPPLLDGLHLSPAAAGALTSIPVFCFGLGAVAAPAAGRRLGGEAALVAALAVIAAGTLLRAAGSTVALFAGTVVAGCGIAIGNVVVPAVIRGRLAHRLGSSMGVYTASMGFGAALAGGLAVPFAHALSRRGSLAIWAVPAVAAALVGAAAVVRDRAPDAGMRGAPAGGRRLLRSRLAWAVTLFFGLQSALFYSGLTWLPSILHSDGFGDAAAGALLSVYALVGVPASLAAPMLAARARDQRLLLSSFASLELVGIAGLLVAPGAAAAWVVVYALGQGGAFALALTVVVLRSPDARRRVVGHGAGGGLLDRRARAAPRRDPAQRDRRLDRPAPLPARARRADPRGRGGVGAVAARRGPVASRRA